MANNVVLALIGGVLGALTQRFILDSTWTSSVISGIVAAIAVYIGLYFYSRRHAS